MEGAARGIQRALVVAVGACDLIAAGTISWWNPSAEFVAFALAYIAALGLLVFGVAKRHLTILGVAFIVTLFADTEPLGGVVASQMVIGRVGLGAVIALIAGFLATAGLLTLMLIEAAKLMNRPE